MFNPHLPPQVWNTQTTSVAKPICYRNKTKPSPDDNAELHSAADTHPAVIVPLNSRAISGWTRH